MNHDYIRERIGVSGQLLTFYQSPPTISLTPQQASHRDPPSTFSRLSLHAPCWPTSNVCKCRTSSSAFPLSARTGPCRWAEIGDIGGKTGSAPPISFSSASCSPATCPARSSSASSRAFSPTTVFSAISSTTCQIWSREISQAWPSELDWELGSVCSAFLLSLTCALHGPCLL